MSASQIRFILKYFRITKNQLLQFFHVEDDMENKDIFVSAFLSVHTWPRESNVWPLKGIFPFL